MNLTFTVPDIAVRKITNIRNRLIEMDSHWQAASGQTSICSDTR
jgi:hypothetical protein